MFKVYKANLPYVFTSASQVASFIRNFDLNIKLVHTEGNCLVFYTY